MKFLIGLCLVAVAAAVPIELTPEVAQATKEHLTAHAAALKGEHALLAPVQGPAFYLADDVAVAAAKPYLADTAEVLAAKPYLADAADVAAAKPYLADAADVAAAKPYLADAADVAAAKPYLADTADVAAAKAAFQKYFDAAAAGTPLTPVTVPVFNTLPVLPKIEVPAVAAPKVVQYTVPSAYYAGYHPYHYTYPYAAYPYWTGFTGLPVVSAPVVAAEKAVVEE
jgi:hypothetical protein